MKKILTVSSANMDFVMNVPYIPQSGETIISNKSYKYVPGGKGANSAVAIARMGGSSLFCTCVGRDSNGDALLALYNNEGIDTRFIYRSNEAPTGLASIMVDGDGQNRIIVFPGANHKITAEAIDFAVEEKPDALFMQFETTPETSLYAAKAASKAGIPIFIDAGPADPDFPLEQLPEAEIFSPNESETEIFTGIKPEDEASCEKAVEELSKRVKAKHYCIKLGDRGCYVDGTMVPSFKTKAVDTTAAGDTFTAVLTLEYLHDKDILRAARVACAAAAIVVSRKGASSSIPYKAEVDVFMEKNK